MSVQVDIGPAVRAFERKREQIVAAVSEVVAIYTVKIHASARENLDKDPRRIDEGTLRGSIHWALSDSLGSVYTNSEYSEFVHYGTGIHGENPKGGHRKTPWVYFDEKRKRFVVTSGMKANKFLADAVNEHRSAFERDVRKAIKSACEKQ